jgi:lipopolysaccharide transport system permease protein
MGTIAEILDSRDILRNLVLRELRSSYKGSVLGFLWSLLNPLVTMVIFTIVF